MDIGDRIIGRYYKNNGNYSQSISGNTDNKFDQNGVIVTKMRHGFWLVRYNNEVGQPISNYGNPDNIKDDGRRYWSIHRNDLKLNGVLATQLARETYPNAVINGDYLEI